MARVTCRFAGASTRPSGIPAPSVSRDRFMPSLRRPAGLGARALAAAGRLGDAPVDREVGQQQADEPVIGVTGDGLQPREGAGLYPLVAALPDRGRRAGAVGDGLIRAAEPQDLDEFLEDDKVADPGPVTAQRMGRIVPDGRAAERKTAPTKAPAAMMGQRATNVSIAATVSSYWPVGYLAEVGVKMGVSRGQDDASTLLIFIE